MQIFQVFLIPKLSKTFEVFFVKKSSKYLTLLMIQCLKEMYFKKGLQEIYKSYMSIWAYYSHSDYCAQVAI